MLWIKIAVIAAVFGSGMWLEGRLKATEIANLKLASSDAALKDFKKDFGIIHDAAVAYQAKQTDLTKQFNSIQEAFDAAVKASPLDPNCKPTAARMRALSDAIAAVNSAIRPAIGSGLPKPVHAPGH